MNTNCLITQGTVGSTFWNALPLNSHGWVCPILPSHLYLFSYPSLAAPNVFIHFLLMPLNEFFTVPLHVYKVILQYFTYYFHAFILNI